MAARMTRKMTEAFVQYSKKMCSRVTIFWMIYRLANFIVVLLRPEIATALVDLSAGIDTIMIVNMSAYTGNSIAEKASIAFAGRKSLYSETESKKEDDNNEEESDSNG